MKDHFQKSIIGALMLMLSWPKSIASQWSFFGAQVLQELSQHDVVVLF